MLFAVTLESVWPSDPELCFLAQNPIAQEDTSQVFETVYICQLGVINNDVWFYEDGIWHGLVKYFSLVQANSQAKEHSSI